MGILERFEKKVEGAVSAVFARTFKGDVQPVEITARLVRELDAEAKLMSRDKRLVPNQFAVQLSQTDHDKLAPYAKTLNTEVGAELRKHDIRVMQVNPSEVQTDFVTSSGRPARTHSERKLVAADIAQTIVSMLELPDRGFITDATVWATNPD